MTLERVARSLDELARTLGYDARLTARTPDDEDGPERQWDTTYRLLFVSAVLAIPTAHRPGAVPALVERAHALFVRAAADRVAGLTYAGALSPGAYHQLAKRQGTWRIFDGAALRGFPVLSATEVQRALTVGTSRKHRRAEARRELREPALEAAIFEDPYDPVRYSVYADWLQERGDPRGELIALQLSETGDAARAAKAQAFVERHAAQLLGPLGQHVHGHASARHEAFTWRFGFIHAARIVCAIDAASGKPRDGVSPAAMLRDLLEHASGRFLVELEVAMHHRPNLQPVIDMLAARQPRALRRLVLGHEGEWRDDVLGDLANAWPAFAALDELAIYGPARHGAIRLPAATRVTLSPRQLTDDVVDAVATAQWPRLQRLALDFADGDRGRERMVQHLAGLDLPALVDLALLRCTYADALAEALAASPGRTRLRRLSFVGGQLTTRGASALATAGMKLEELDIRRCRVSSDGVRALRAITRSLDATDLR